MAAPGNVESGHRYSPIIIFSDGSAGANHPEREDMRSSLTKKVLRGLLVTALITGGTTLTVAAPALAAGNCNGHSPVSACIDYGASGNNARVDFYLNYAPSDQYYTFNAWININGSWHVLKNNGRLDHSGNYCCWYYNTDNLPNIWQTIYSSIDVYNRSGTRVSTSDSGPIRILN